MRDWDRVRGRLADEVGWAEREGQRSEGDEIAVYGFREGKVAEVWFYVDGYEPEAFTAVFAFD